LAKNDPMINQTMLDAIQGISNLKDTYAMCHQTCARIDTVLDKIRRIEVKVADSVKVVEGMEDINFREE
jgi:hypothetical protein